MIEGALERINGHPTYLLGLNIGYVGERLSLGPPQQTPDYTNKLAWLKWALDVFIDLNPLPLVRSKNAAQQLRQVVDYLATENSANRTIPQQAITDFFERGRHFSSILAEDLNELDLFVVSPKRILDTKALISGSAVSLSPEIVEDIPREGLFDAQEAGRCLAFGRATATGFHLFRLVEAVVLLYMPILKIELAPSDRNLGVYTKRLKERGVRSRVIELLEHLRTEYRNPLMHPDAVWDLEEATDAFLYIPSVISTLVKDQRWWKQALSGPGWSLLTPVLPAHHSSGGGSA